MGGGNSNDMITVLEMAGWLRGGGASREEGEHAGAALISMVFFLHTLDADATREIGFREYVRFKRYVIKQKNLREEQRKALLRDFAEKTFTRFCIDGRISDDELPRL